VNDSTSNIDNDSLTFDEDPVLYLDQFGNRHLYLRTNDGKVLISESETVDGNFFTTNYLPSNTDTSVAIQFDHSGLINRIESGTQVLNIRYLGQDNFLFDGVDIDGIAFSQNLNLPGVAKKSSGSGEKFQLTSPEYTARDRRTASVPYDLALMCEDGSILTAARV